MGIGRLGTAMYLIDGKGVIIDEYGPAYADVDLPIIDGIAASPQDGGSIVDVTRAEFAGRVIGAVAVRPEIARRVSQIDVADLHDAVVILDGDAALLRLGDTEFVARLQQYIDLAPALHERLAGIDYVDLRFDERLYVRPPKAAARAKTVGDGRTRGTTGTIRGRSRHRDGQGLHRGRRAAGRRRCRRDRHRRDRLEGPEARRRRQSRGGGRLDQEVDRGSRADGGRRGRLGAAGDQRTRTSRASTAAASSRWPARTAR